MVYQLALARFYLCNQLANVLKVKYDWYLSRLIVLCFYITKMVVLVVVEINWFHVAVKRIKKNTSPTHTSTSKSNTVFTQVALLIEV